MQWHCENEAAGGGWVGGGAALEMAPPPVILFCLLVWYACHVVCTTCNDHWSFHVIGTKLWVDGGVTSPTAVQW